MTGPELMELMRQQACNFGTRIVTDDIVDVDFSRRPFQLTAREGNVVEAQTRDRGHGRTGQLPGPALRRSV